MTYQNKIFRMTLICVLFFFSLCGAASLLNPPVNLKCEYRGNPLGIDVKNPRLFWEVSSPFRGAVQTKYQVLVAGDLQKLNQEQADLWDSGIVESNSSIQIEYGGAPLKSGQRCYWKVRTWDRNNNPSEFSAPAWWEMGLLKKKDWQGTWIGDGTPAPENDSLMYGDIPVPLFRKQFATGKKIKNARLYVTGLGYFEVYLNGEKISSDILSPGWTNYAKRIQYLTYDLTADLDQGDNAIGIMLGNGWYNPLPLPFFNRLNLREILTIGQPKFILQLNITFEDGTQTSIVSDESWKAGKGPILRNNIYLGEVYDARLEQPGWDTIGFDDAAWKPAVKATPPGGQLVAQIQPPIRVTRVLKPVKITEPKPGIFIFDMGQNFAGVARLKVSGPAGTKVQLRYGELIHDDGTLNWSTTIACHISEDSYVQHRPGMPKNALQSDTYILKGEGKEVFNSRFTFHGFRYVEVTGYPGTPTLDDLEGLRLNTDIKQCGEFSCSSDLFNKIHENTQWTFLSNIFSIESDCPGREKFGYGGDIVAASEAYIQNYDMSAFYIKTVRDFQDDQRPSGGMPECAPDNAIYDSGITPDTGPIGWMYAYPWLQEKLYRYYGDKKLIEEHYQSTRRLVDFINENTPDHIVKKGIGDHGSLERRGIGSVSKRDSPVTSTFFYYDHARLMALLAEILDQKADADKSAKLARDIKAAFLQKYLDGQTGKIAEGLQAYQAMGLYYDLLPDNLKQAALDLLVGNIMNDRNGHIASGIFGTKVLFDVLRMYNRNDIAFIMNDQMTFPGYGAMIANGATTIYENWRPEGGGSKNHPMFGSVDEWLFKSILGIVHHPDAVGFDKMIFKPFIVGDLQWAKGYYHSIRGKIGSAWKMNGNTLFFNVSVPANTQAVIYCPVTGKKEPTISEGGTVVIRDGVPVNQVSGLEFTGIENDFCLFNAGSGEYNFVVQ